MTIGGKKWPISWATPDPQQDRQTLKLLDINMNPSPKPQTMCMMLGEPCRTLQEFCWPQIGVCQFALFNPRPFNCCPIEKIQVRCITDLRKLGKGGTVLAVVYCDP